jgi:hypothetical protein
MPDYKNGKIYMIESKEGNIRYYGSTTQTLKKDYKDIKKIRKDTKKVNIIIQHHSKY